MAGVANPLGRSPPAVAGAERRQGRSFEVASSFDVRRRRSRGRGGARRARSRPFFQSRFDSSSKRVDVKLSGMAVQ